MSSYCDGILDCSNGLDELSCFFDINDIVAESGNVNVSIKCERNCDLYYANPKDSIVLKASCFDCSNITSHKWTIHYFKNQQTFQLTENDTNTGLNTSYLSLKPSLLAGTYYQVILNVSVNDGNYGTEQLVFITNTAPYGGSCIVSPNKGQSLTTRFSIDCAGWLDQNIGDVFLDGGSGVVSATENSLGLKYTFYYLKRGDSQKSVLADKGTSPSTSDKLIPAGDNDYNFQIDVIVKISDKHGSYIEYITNITVEPYEISIENLTVADNSLTDQLLENNDTEGALSLLFAVTVIINDENIEDEQGLETSTTEEARILAREAMVGKTIQAIDLISTIEQLSQAAIIVESITEATEEVSELVEEQSANALDTITEKLLDTSEILLEDLFQITTDITQGVGNIFKSKQESKPITVALDGDNTVSSKLSSVLEVVGTKMLQSMAPGQQHSFTSPTVNMILKRLIKRDANKAKMTAENGVGISLPTVAELFPGLNLNSLLDIEFITLENGIFVDSLSYLLNGKSITFSLHNDDSNKIEVSNLDENIILELPKNEDSNSEVIAIDVESDSQLPDESYFFLANIMVKEKRSVILKLMNCNRCDIGTNITVFVGNNSAELLINHFYSDSKPCIDSIDEVYSFIIPEQYIIENMTFIGIQQYGPINCKLDVFTPHCYFWDTSTNSYQSDGCLALESSTRDVAYCACNHLTTFISGFSIYPPEPIDWNLVLTGLQNLHANAAVFSVIFIIAGFYIIFVYIAWKKDNSDSNKWKVNIIQSNFQKNPYLYQINVYTGVVGGAGTTSKISLILTGDRGHSEIICLNGEEKKERKELPRGSDCQFLVGVPKYLGTILSVRIWHDNSGTWGNQSWYLNKITVIDILKKERFCFLCERWLAIEENDGKVERVLRLASESDLKQVKQLFSNNTHFNLNDGHLWLSIISRPRKSRFTRVQRLSCCMSLLYSTMMVNCMWYQETLNQGNDTLINLGPINLSWKAIYIGLISSLIVFPVNLLIVQIFRKSKLSKNYCRPCTRSENHEIPTLVLALDTDEIRDVVAYENDLKAELGKYDDKFQSEVDNSECLMREKRDSIPNEISIPKQDLKISLVEKKVLEPKKLSSTQPLLKKSGALPPLPAIINIKNEKDIDLTPTVLPHIYKKEHKKFQKESTSHISTKAEKVEEGIHQHKKRKSLVLPHWCVYIGWILVLSICLVSASLTIAYSLQWEATDSNNWLLAFFVSFCEDILILQPIKVITIALILTILLKQYGDDNQDSEIDDIYYSEKMNIEIDEKPMMTCDVSPEQMKKLKERRKKEVTMQMIIKEIIIYVLFLILLWFIAYSSRDPEAIDLYTSIDNTFFKTEEFEEINGNFDSLYKWMNEVMLPGLYATKYYNGDYLNLEEANLFSDLASFRLGPPRLRQLRVKAELCTPLSQVSSLIFECLADYNFHNEEVNNFGENWRAFNSNDTFNYTKFWQYETEKKLNGLTTYGTFNNYKGGGYVVEFGLTDQDSRLILDYLWNTSWLDDYTRALFIEFNLYNSNVDMFSYVKLLLEYPSTGGALPNVFIKVLRLSEFTGDYWIFILVLELIFVALLIYYLVKEIIQIFKLKCSYFSQFWHIIEVFKLGVCIAAVVFYALKTETRLTTLSGIYNIGLEKYISLEEAVFYDEAYGYMVAFVVFFSTLKIWHYLRFYKRMALMYSTLQVAAWGLFTFFVMFFILFLSFGQLFYLVMGSDLYEYHSIGTSLETLFSMWLGVFEFHSLQQTSRIIAPMAFFFFALIVYAILTFFFLSIIIHAFHEIKQDNNKMNNDYEILQFLSENIRAIVGLNKNEEKFDSCKNIKSSELMDQSEDNLSNSNELKLVIDKQKPEINEEVGLKVENTLPKTIVADDKLKDEKNVVKNEDNQTKSDLKNDNQLSSKLKINIKPQPEKRVKNDTLKDSNTEKITNNVNKLKNDPPIDSKISGDKSRNGFEENMLLTDKLDLQVDKILELVIENEKNMKSYYRRKRKLLSKLLKLYRKRKNQLGKKEKKKNTKLSETIPKKPSIRGKEPMGLANETAAKVFSVMDQFYKTWEKSRGLSWGESKVKNRDLSWGRVKLGGKVFDSMKKKDKDKRREEPRK